MRKWLISIGIFIGVVVFVFLVFTAYKHYTVPVASVPVARPAEQVEPAPAEAPLIKVSTGRVNTYGNLVVEVVTPGAGSLHWEDSQGMIASDTFTWKKSLSGDIELSPIGNTAGLRPVLTTSQEVVKGNPIP